MKLGKFINVALAAALAAVGCDMMGNLGGDIDLKLNITEMAFNAEGGSETFTFVAPQDWEITCSEDWLEADPNKGTASSETLTITVNVEPNPDETVREAELTIKVGTVEEKIIVEQAAADKGGEENPGEGGGDNGGEDEPGKQQISLSEVSNLADDEEATVSGWVMGRYRKGVVITDGRDNLLLYDEKQTADKNVGDSLVVTAVKATYGGQAQLQNVSSIEVLSQVKVWYPEPVVYTGENIAELIGKTAPTYIKYVGVLEQYGNYFNIRIEGSDMMGSVAFAEDALEEELAGMVGTTVTVTGYHIAMTDENRYVSTLVVDVESDGQLVEPDEPDQPDQPELQMFYYNDFDAVVAEKTYGSGENWPYLDQFDGWMNQIGTGAENVTYSYKGMSARANSTSDGDYSDYAGSGNNNIFFGSNAYFAVKNIALDHNTEYSLMFGTEKYSKDYGSIFTPSEFHIYLSNDGGNKWVEFTDYTFAGGETGGRWNIASANFSVPAGTENLSICFKTDVASSYRLDDLVLMQASELGGTYVDFSNAVEMDFGSNNGGGENPDPGVPAEPVNVTVAEFCESAVSTVNWYRLEGTVGGPINTTYGNFDIIDETGKVYVYGISNWSEYKDKVAEGGKIVVVGQRGEYNGKVEVLEGYIESYRNGGLGTEDFGNGGEVEW